MVVRLKRVLWRTVIEKSTRLEGGLSKSLYEILMVVMSGVAVGVKSILDILKIARCEEKWLRDKVKLDFPNGFSSYDTVRRVLGMIDPKKFQEAFIKFLGKHFENPWGQLCKHRRKTLRGSGNKANGIDALHLLHAYSYEYGVVIGQLECHKEKTYEIPVSKELVGMLK